MLEKCVLNSYLILLFSRKIPTFSYFLMKIPTFSYFFELSYYLTPWKDKLREYSQSEQKQEVEEYCTTEPFLLPFCTLAKTFGSTLVKIFFTTKKWNKLSNSEV